MIRRLKDTWMTWPWFTVELKLPPWHWKLRPRAWHDVDPPRDRQHPAGGAPEYVAGYRTLRLEWLFFTAELSWNIPAFRGTWRETA